MSRRGMTLIEVVIALAILALIAGISVGMLTGTSQLRDVVVNSDVQLRSARNAMSRLQKELRIAFLTSNRNAVGTYQTVFIGKDQGDQDQLWFATMSHHRKYFNAAEGDQAEITLWTDWKTFPVTLKKGRNVISVASTNGAGSPAGLLLSIAMRDAAGRYLADGNAPEPVRARAAETAATSPLFCWASVHTSGSAHPPHVHSGARSPGTMWLEYAY